MTSFTNGDEQKGLNKHSFSRKSSVKIVLRYRVEFQHYENKTDKTILKELKL